MRVRTNGTSLKFYSVGVYLYNFFPPRCKNHYDSNQQDSCCDGKWRKQPQRGLVLQTIRPTHTNKKEEAQQQKEHRTRFQLLGLEVAELIVVFDVPWNWKHAALRTPFSFVFSFLCFAHRDAIDFFGVFRRIDCVTVRAGWA